MEKVCIKHISKLFLKIVENMFFLDGEHVGLGGMLPQKITQPSYVVVISLVLFVLSALLPLFDFFLISFERLTLIIPS